MNVNYDQLTREDLVRLLAGRDGAEAGRVFGLVFQACPDPILVARQKDGRIVLANTAFERIYGRPVEQVIGRTTVELGLWSAEQRGRMLQVLAAAGRVQNLECVVADRSGRHHHGLMSAEPIEVEGEKCLVSVFRDLTEQKRAEQALRESEARFEALASAAFEGIAISENGRVVEVNDQMAQMLGYTRQELMGASVGKFVAPESRALVEEMIRSRNPGPYMHLAARKDGTTFPVEVQARCISLGGRQMRVTSIRDITSRKAAEQLLRTSEERLRATIENTPHVAVQWYDVQGRILFWNRASETIFGWKSGEAIGKKLDQLILKPEQAAEFLRVIEEVHRTGVSAGPGEYVFRRRDGSEGVCLSTTFRIPMGGDQSCVVCMDVDITGQKRAAEALRESEERFEMAVRGSNDGIWDWNITTNRIYHSPRLNELLGYDPGEFPGALDSFKANLHPEDFDRTWKAIEAHLETRKPYDAEFRLKTKSGEYRWFRSRAQAVWDEAGKPVRMAGSIADIHDRKVAEESLRAAQAEALVSQEAFTQQLISAQERERKRLASELHDSLGQNLSLIKNRAFLALKQESPENAANHLEAIGKLAADGIAEVRNLAQNLRPLHIDEFGVTDSLGELVNRVAQSTPIRIEPKLENVDDLFRGEAATTLYRIVQEALNNLIKHSQAERATVSLERDLHCVRLRVEDNGQGFDLKAVTAARKTRGGIGLTSIGERVRMLGGLLQIKTAPGRGTRLRMEIPLRETSHSAGDE